MNFDESFDKAKIHTKLLGLDEAVADVLRSANTGKSDPPVRAFLTAYQILNRLPDVVRQELAFLYGESGKDAGKKYGPASRVSRAVLDLSGTHTIEIVYMDSEGVQFEIAGQGFVAAGYHVAALYRMVGS